MKRPRKPRSLSEKRPVTRDARRPRGKERGPQADAGAAALHRGGMGCSDAAAGDGSRPAVGALIRQAPKPDITVTLRCNNRCVFCPRTILSRIAVADGPGLEQRLKLVRGGGDRVVLTGGEVTVLHDFFDIVETCRSLGFREIAVISNGRRFSDRKFAFKAALSAVTEVCLTVYDLRPSVHDRLTGVKGSLRETKAGLENLLAAAKQNGRPAVRINTILCRDNAGGMVRLIEDMAGRGITNILVADAVLSDSFSEPLGYEGARDIAADIEKSRALGSCNVVLRGFPLCIFQGLERVVMGEGEGGREPGAIAAELQDIDTAFAPQGEVDEYFLDFFSNFRKIEACRGCRFEDRCPGVQKRYLEALGSDEFAPVVREAARILAPRRTIEETIIEEREDPARLAVTPTTACQLCCSYCKVKLGKKHAPARVLHRAADLLLTSGAHRSELQFFGGEPLLRMRQVLGTMERADRLARAGGREVLFTITTNGLFLDENILRSLKDFNVRVLFSMDGDLETQARCRFVKKKNPARLQALMERNLEALMKSGIPHFVNMVVAPETARLMESNFDFFARKGVGIVQVCYANAVQWNDEDRELFLGALETVARKALLAAGEGRGPRLQNMGSSMEPTMLSNDLLVDVDGKLYGDAALFCEKAFPGLRKPYGFGHVDNLEGFDGLRRSKKENLRILRSFYSPGTGVRNMLERQLEFGVMVDSVLKKALEEMEQRDDGPKPENTVRPPAGIRDSNPLLDRVFRKDLSAQLRFMHRRPRVMKLPVLLIENPCSHDCIFCKSKPIEPTGMDRIGTWLEGNRNAGARRLGLIGNEPLMHPKIFDILALARGCGFERFEALTSGHPLGDLAFAGRLVDAGVDTFSIPLYSSSPDEHDAITRTPGSGRSTLAAARFLDDAGAKVFVHANLLKQNMGGMAGLESHVRGTLGLPFCIIPVRPKTANMAYADVAPSYSRMVEILGGRVVSLVGFPLCVCGKIQPDALVSPDILSDLLKLYLLDQGYVKPPPACGSCPLRGRCTGTYEEHLRVYGPDILAPP
ncbi:MAG: radical SAM protein [Pseudomonadota bacterium]